MKKKQIKILGWVAFLLAIIVVMGFVNVSRESTENQVPEIKINVHGEMLFITEDDILHRLFLQQWTDTARRVVHNDLDEIEAFINAMPEIEKAEVFKTLNGKVNLEVTLKQVVARVFNRDGTSYYLDSRGRVMPLSINYTAKVPVISGNVQLTPEDPSALEVIHIDSLKNKKYLPELYRLSLYVCSDAFLRSQITQIVRQNNGEYALIPRVGDHIIQLGSAEDAGKKMENLKIFYKEGLKKVNGNIYDTINLQFKDQVVCSKK